MRCPTSWPRCPFIDAATGQRCGVEGVNGCAIRCFETDGDTVTHAVSLQALSECNLVVTDQIHSWQHVLDLFNFHGLSPASVQRTHSFEFQRSLVANGFGVALTYTRPFGDHSYDGQPLVCRPIREDLPAQRIVLAYDQRYPLTPPAEAFKQQALTWFKERLPFASN